MTYIGSLQGSSGSTSSLSSLMPQNTNSIQGLASGMDTQSIVDGLVMGAQAPLVSLLQQRQTLMWKSEQYQQVNSALTNLQTSLSNMRLQSPFMAQQATSSDSSVVTATADGLAPNGSYTVKVNNLASGATITSQAPLSSDPGYGNIALDKLPNNAMADGVFNIKVNGQSIAVDPSTDTINTVLQKITSDAAAGVSGFYDANSGQVVLQTTATGKNASLALSADTTSESNQLFQTIMGLPTAPTYTQSSTTSSSLNSTAFTNGVAAKAGDVYVNGTKISVTAGEKLTDVATAISKVSGVSATFDSTSNTLSLSMTGLYTPLNLVDPNNVLQLPSYTENLPTSGYQAPQDASYSVNGVNSTSPNNSPVFNGVTLNLTGTTTGTNGVTVNVSSDSSKVVQTISDFVKTYNQTLQTLQGLYNQRRDYSYQPLTAAQESQMSQTQIDEWNQKAQAGLLAYDPTVGRALSSVKEAASNILSGLTTNGSVTSLSSIGITPISPMSGVASGDTAPGVTTTGWNTYGLLQIDTTKLTQAVQSNPQEVMTLFTNSAPDITTTQANGSTTSSPDNTKLGLAKQMYTAVSNAMTEITQNAGNPSVTLPTTPNANTGQILLPSTGIDPNANLTSLFSSDAYNPSVIGQQVSAMDKRAEAMQKQINSQRTMWQNQFAKMEQTIQSLNSQQSQLIGMLG